MRRSFGAACDSSVDRCRLEGILGSLSAPATVTLARSTTKVCVIYKGRYSLIVHITYKIGRYTVQRYRTVNTLVVKSHNAPQFATNKHPDDNVSNSE